jgi:hypothetical protein
LITGHRKHLAPSSDGASSLAVIWNLSRTLIHVLCVFRLLWHWCLDPPALGEVVSWRRLGLAAFTHPAGVPAQKFQYMEEDTCK